MSYALNVPIVGIFWNNKQLMFSKIIKNENYFVTKENFNEKYISDLIIDAIKNQKNNTAKLKKTSYDFFNNVFDTYKKM